MLIDWFTVIAQIANFLILIWLLRRFLYKPILKAVDDREKLIQSQIKNADALKAEAKKEGEEFKRKNEELTRQTEAIKQKTTDDAKAERQRLFDEANKEYNDLRTKLEEGLRNEQEAQGGKITRQIQEEVFSITKKTLSDIASANLEQQIVEVFIKRLGELKEEDKVALASSLKTSPSVTIKSSFNIPPAQQVAMESAIHKSFNTKANVQFQISTEQIGGLEFITNEYKIAWNISNYISSLEKNVADAMKEKPALNLTLK